MAQIYLLDSKNIKYILYYILLKLLFFPIIQKHTNLIKSSLLSPLSGSFISLNSTPFSFNSWFEGDFSNTHAIGNVMYTEYIHLFQNSGIILLLSMIGAIVLTYRKREGVKKQSYFTQVSREREDSIKLVEVESNKGVNLDD